MAEELSLGTRIRQARERLHWTQQRLADEVGKSVRTVNDWENDRTEPKNSVGALEEKLGVALYGGGTLGLPPLVAENAHIPEVIQIYEALSGRMPAATVLGLIRLWLERYGPPPPGRRQTA